MIFFLLQIIPNTIPPSGNSIFQRLNFQSAFLFFSNSGHISYLQFGYGKPNFRCGFDFFFVSVSVYAFGVGIKLLQSNLTVEFLVAFFHRNSIIGKTDLWE